MDRFEARISPDLAIRSMSAMDAQLLLGVYQQCEDFLALGPAATASIAMILADLDRSAADNGCYCGIWKGDDIVGVVDWVAGSGKDAGAFLNLLVLARPHRGQGIGRRVLSWLESQLLIGRGAATIETAVQVNNEAGMDFWRRQGYRPIRGPVRNDDGTTVIILGKQLASGSK